MMKKEICIVILASFLLLSASDLFGVDAPQYKEGEKWRIRFERKTIASISGLLTSGVYEVVYRDGKFVWYAAGSGTNAGEGLREEDAITFYGKYKDIPFLRFPLNIKDERKYRYFNPRVYNPRTRASGADLDGVVTVEKLERVKTEAGEFEGYKHVLEETGAGGVRRTYVYYYVPDCKCISKFSTEFGSGAAYSGELLSYEPAK